MSRYYTVGNMRNDPPVQRAWVRGAAALALKVAALRPKSMRMQAVVMTVMLAGDYLWETKREQASFADFRADPLLKRLTTRFFGPQSEFDKVVEAAFWFEDVLRSAPEVLQDLPLPAIKETDDAIMIPMPSDDRGPSFRDEVRAASKRAWAKARRSSRTNRASHERGTSNEAAPT